MTARPTAPRTPRGEQFDHVQRIVLCTPRQPLVQHLLLQFVGTQSQARRFLAALGREVSHHPSRYADPEAQLSIGFSYRGLEALGVPLQVRLVLQKLAPSFYLGAPVQAATRLGDTGASSPDRWDRDFRLEALHGVVSLHNDGGDSARKQLARVEGLAAEFRVRLSAQPLRGENFSLGGPTERWVHFGYRDGLSRVRIKGWSHSPDAADDENRTLDISAHSPGEFLLGHPDDSGANPWTLVTQSRAVRSFFCEASFGVLRQMEQDEPAFRGWVEQRAAQMAAASGGAMSRQAATALVQAKLCGRFPDGRRIDAQTQAPLGQPKHDFDYRDDLDGKGCPFGAHMRRMNPRGGEIAHGLRRRPLMRRGAPYGPRWRDDETGPVERGLLGLFFCSSIENQFEHLLGEWADRVPMGNRDVGEAKDPLVSRHERPDARFDLPGGADAPGGLKEFDGLKPFVRTRGTAYLLYPTRDGLQQLATEDDGNFWVDEVDREAFE